MSFINLIKYYVFGKIGRQKEGSNMVQTNLPVLLLKSTVLFPYNEIRLEVSSSRDRIVLETAYKYYDQQILVLNLNDPLEENPSLDDLPTIGVVGKIKSRLTLPSGDERIVIAGLERVQVVNYILNDYGYIDSFVISLPVEESDELEVTALRRILFREINTYIDSSSIGNSVIGKITGVDDIGKLTDIICAELPISYSKKLKYLRHTKSVVRLHLLLEDLKREIETIQLENEIESSLKEKIDSSQRDYLLREKIRIMREELGEFTIKDTEANLLKKRIQEKRLPNRVRVRLEEELKRYTLSTDASPEVTIIRSYIDWLLNLPWYEGSRGRYQKEKVEEVLNESHYGLDTVKSRIVEFVSVAMKIKKMESTIICLVGPPGVGKTTLARSIAEALDKKFVKISVGGISDEAEIVGHRRTYLGSSPGKIIQGMKKVGVNNPVFLIDEVDKLSKDYHGDPASSLLEVLDNEQNSHFCDNYIEEEFDLSRVLFILTANDVSKIPSALRDRLEIIEISSYTNYDKREIARKHLIPKLFKEYHIKDNNVVIDDSAILKMIEEYTRESGARELKRKIEEICRKVITNDIRNVVIDDKNLSTYLGMPKYFHQQNEDLAVSGVVNALAYTVYGGEILKISVASYKGEGNLKVTGNVGKVMLESVEVAFSYVRSNAFIFEIDDLLFQFRDFHVHIEEGASLKDGPSAGVAVVSAIVSLLKNQVVSNEFSMTGEITLRGEILPIGGIREKLIAATVNGIKRVFIPYLNKQDLEEVPEEVKKSLDLVLVKNYQDIYYYLFGMNNENDGEVISK